MNKQKFYKVIWIVIIVTLLCAFIGLKYVSNNENILFKKLKGEIVFESNKDNHLFGLYMISNNGVKFLCEGSMPDISADGEEVIFVRRKKKESNLSPESKLSILDLKTMRTKDIKISDAEISFFSSPAFSVSKNKIAYVAKVNNYDNVFIKSLKEDKIKKITNYSKNTVRAERNFINKVAWRNENEIIYNNWGEGIFLVNINNKEKKLLLDGKGFSVGEFAVSPNGKTLVFAGNGKITGEKVQYKYSELFLMDIETKNIERLTDNSWGDEYPCWSPDGTKICFTSFRHHNTIVGGELYVLDLKSKKEYQLTKAEKIKNIHPFFGSTTDKYPTWSK